MWTAEYIQMLLEQRNKTKLEVNVLNLTASDTWSDQEILALVQAARRNTGVYHLFVAASAFTRMETMRPFLELLKESRHLKEIHFTDQVPFRHGNLTPGVIDLFLAATSANRRSPIEEVTLGVIGRRPLPLFKAVSGMRRLRSLRLVDRIEWSNRYAWALAGALQKIKNLQNVSLSLNGRYAARIISALKHHPKLDTVRLYELSNGEFITDLLTLISSSRNLKTLTVHGHGETFTDVSNLFYSVKYPDSLVALNIVQLDVSRKPPPILVPDTTVRELSLLRSRASSDVLLSLTRFEALTHLELSLDDGMMDVLLDPDNEVCMDLFSNLRFLSVECTRVREQYGMFVGLVKHAPKVLELAAKYPLTDQVADHIVAGLEARGMPFTGMKFEFDKYEGDSIDSILRALQTEDVWVSVLDLKCAQPSRENYVQVYRNIGNFRVLKNLRLNSCQQRQWKVDTAELGNVLLDSLRRNTVIRSITGLHFSFGQKETRKTLENYLKMNRAGRRFLSDPEDGTTDYHMLPYVFARTARQREFDVLHQFIKMYFEEGGE